MVPTRIDFNIMAEEKQETETTVSLIENPVELFGWI